MNLKESVLGYLESHREEDVSGEALAELFGVSRSAVWKAISTLRDEGFEIEAATNKGYRLMASNDILSVSGMEQWLRPELSGLLHVYGETDSTNNRARELAIAGAVSGTAVVADTQTSGRGRLGRAFVSPPGSGIYLSLVMRPQADMKNGILITTAAAVGVCRAIHRVTGRKPGIKWVNDLYLDGRKITGILTEAVTSVENGSIESVVIGIGINFKADPESFPEELKNRIGWIFEETEPNTTRNQLAAEVLNEVYDLCIDLDSSTFMDEYRASSIVIGKSIYYIKNGKEHPVNVIDIDDKGGLVVEDKAGKRQTLTSGEISIRWENIVQE